MKYFRPSIVPALLLCYLLNEAAVTASPATHQGYSSGSHNNSSSNNGSSRSCSCNDNVVYTHELPSIQDVTISGINQLYHKNYLAVGTMPRYPKARALLQFADIPRSCKLVVNAEIYLYYYRSYMWAKFKVPFEPKFVEVRQVLKEWKETEATCDNRHGHVKWATPYLELNETDAMAQKESVRIISESTGFGYVSFDITCMAQRWLTGDGNYGVLLSLANETRRGRQVHFHSKESKPEMRPFLRVKCWSDFCASRLQRTGRKEQPGDNEADPTTAEGREAGCEDRAEKQVKTGDSSYTIPANTYNSQC